MESFPVVVWRPLVRRVLALVLVLVASVALLVVASVPGHAAPSLVAEIQSQTPVPGGGDEPSPPTEEQDGNSEPPPPTDDSGDGESEPPPPTTPSSPAVRSFDRTVERVLERLRRSDNPAARRAADRIEQRAERIRARLCERPRVRC